MALGLVRAFSVKDAKRGRVIIGQGTFETEFEQTSQDEVYQGLLQGRTWNVNQIFPKGPIPTRRYSSCAAYIYNEDEGLDGVLVMGGNTGGPAAETLEEVWWLRLLQHGAGGVDGYHRAVPRTWAISVPAAAAPAPTTSTRAPSTPGWVAPAPTSRTATSAPPALGASTSRTWPTPMPT